MGMGALVDVMVVAGISNVPTSLISGTGPDEMEKFGGTMSVVGVNVLVGSVVVLSVLVAVGVGVAVTVALAIGVSVLFDGVTCGSGKVHGAVLFPESVGAGSFEPLSVVLAVAFAGIELVGSGISLPSVGVGSDKGSTVE
jgi:hypothetical protein